MNVGVKIKSTQKTIKKFVFRVQRCTACTFLRRIATEKFKQTSRLEEKYLILIKRNECIFKSSYHTTKYWAKFYFSSAMHEIVWRGEGGLCVRKFFICYTLNDQRWEGGGICVKNFLFDILNNGEGRGSLFREHLP